MVGRSRDHDVRGRSVWLPSLDPGLNSRSLVDLGRSILVHMSENGGIEVLSMAPNRLGCGELMSMITFFARDWMNLLTAHEERIERGPPLQLNPQLKQCPRTSKVQVVTPVQESPVAFLDSLLLGEWEDRVQRGLFRYDVTACATKV
ncbi:hypothetical protein IFM89_031459 [Coptis chinensis]|uniref:GDPGP1-like N-terminal domain-containing protein n=1 Tax=Coptis chinensis TaxID=261450 RepID=A0A835HGU6_9MAGN|nr:hypothetical protein IFM89_031459 [Coptis chinensis]